MAYMSKERKAARVPVIKAILKKYGQKGTLSVRNHSTLLLKIKDVKGMFTLSEMDKRWGMDVNHYWINDHYEGKAAKMLNELKDAMYGKDYYDRSDAMTDYFDCSHYISIRVFGA